MKLARHTLVALAFAAFAPAHAADKDAPGFTDLDRNDDGQLSRTEAGRNPALLKRFGDADTDKDGRVSRAEYLKVMAAKDFTEARKSVADAVDPDTPDRRPPGFDDLDRDNDGKLTRGEAARNPVLAKRFDETDGDKDGRVTRFEYLKTMAGVDWRNARDNMADFIRPGESSTGASAKE